ncbi:hypothetical protein PUN28_000984 [Cardiocondyla obscurior]|uniref:Uncharacterized protein n=1 Tax=Cardiocondyla obscurior TaxID=286306 RepID=A0AAW2H2E8_9HYME
MENEPVDYLDDAGKMDDWRKEDRWTSGEIQKTTKRSGPHNGHLRSHFTQRRIRRWATIVEKGKRGREKGYSIPYKNGRY